MESGDHSIISYFSLKLLLNDSFSIVSGKPQLWSAHEAQIFNKDFCSDGFCLNLCYLMLKLCYPFAKPCCDKLLKISPSYTKTVIKSEQEAAERWVHAQGEVLILR